MKRQTPNELLPDDARLHTVEQDFVRAAQKYSAELDRFIEAWEQYRQRSEDADSSREVAGGQSAAFQEQGARKHRQLIKAFLDEFEKEDENRTEELQAAKLPRCLRCDKSVDRLVISPIPRNTRRVLVEYECHGETVRQEMPTSALAGDKGLSWHTAFNDYTSGLMPGKS